MRVSRRSEIVLGLVVPLLAIFGLLAVGMSTDQAAVCVAFMAAVPMFAALFTGAAFTSIVAGATLVAAMVTAASAYGQDFYDAVPIMVGVIVGAGAAVIASQMTSAAPRRDPMTQQAVGGGEGPPRAAEPGIDELTGLPTRKGVTEALTRAEPGGPRVVALLDCEGVAAVNDQYGRAIGDVFIFAVAGRTRWALPDEDTVARWDGGTFLMVISGDATAVQPTLELVADKVNKNPIRCDAGLVPTTVSLGAAVWPGGTDFSIALDRARRALHAAKSQGPARLVMDA